MSNTAEIATEAAQQTTITKSQLAIGSTAAVGASAPPDIYAQVSADYLVTHGALGLSWSVWMQLLASAWLGYNFIVLTLKNINAIRKCLKRRREK